MIGGESCSLEFCALLHRPPLASSMKGGDLFAAERLSGFVLFAMSTSCHHFGCTPSACIKSSSLLRSLGFYIRSHLAIDL